MLEARLEQADLLKKVRKHEVPSTAHLLTLLTGRRCYQRSRAGL